MSNPQKKKLGRPKSGQIKTTTSVTLEVDVMAKVHDYCAKQKITFSRFCNLAFAEFIAKSTNEKSKIM